MKQDTDSSQKADEGQDQIMQSHNATIDAQLDELEKKKEKADQVTAAFYEAEKANIEHQRRLAEEMQEKRRKMAEAPICQNCKWWHNPEHSNGGEHACRFNYAGNWIFTLFNNRCSQFTPMDGKEPARCRTCKHWHDVRFDGNENSACRHCTAYPRTDFRASQVDADDYCGLHEPERTE